MRPVGVCYPSLLKLPLASTWTFLFDHSFSFATVGSEPSLHRVKDVLSAHSARLDVLLQDDNVRAIKETDVVLFSVKPVKREAFFNPPGIREALRGKLLLSIMAGISTTEPTRLLANGEPAPVPLQIVRAMLNMAAKIREAVTLYAAQELVVNSAIGMMRLVPAGDHPSVLREKIASPGGCSIRALLKLERQGVRSAYTSAIMAAAERSRNMSPSLRLVAFSSYA